MVGGRRYPSLASGAAIPLLVGIVLCLVVNQSRKCLGDIPTPAIPPSPRVEGFPYLGFQGPGDVGVAFPAGYAGVRFRRLRSLPSASRAAFPIAALAGFPATVRAAFPTATRFPVLCVPTLDPSPHPSPG